MGTLDGREDGCVVGCPVIFVLVVKGTSVGDIDGNGEG